MSCAHAKPSCCLTPPHHRGLASRYVWADAVCTSQGDSAEKSVQIPMMSNTYQGAARAFVWLGLGGSYNLDAEARAGRLDTLPSPQTEHNEERS
jgi:hypothetical protein